MTKPIEEILAPKPEARLRIYAYSIDDAAHVGLLKVGQTTRGREDARCRAVSRPLHQELHDRVDEPAERDDGTIFTDHRRSRTRSKEKGFENPAARVDAVLGRRRQDRHHRAAHRPEAHRHAPRDVRDAARAERGGRQDARATSTRSGGGHARRPAVPVEREDALRQDVHRVPARQEARREARARGDVQAGGRGRVADRPRVPRRLRRLAVPLALLRQRPDADRS